MLPTNHLFTLCMVRAFWRDRGSFGGFSKCPLNYNICALLYGDRGSTQYQRQVNIFSFNPQFAFPCNHDFCVVKLASTMCSNSACESHNNLLLYLLNNKVLSYLISANTASVLRTQCQITSRRTLFHVELSLKSFRLQYELTR